MDERSPGSDDDRHERFAELYATHFRPLVAFCRRQLGGAGDPEELAQEAFLRAWTSWDRYAPARPFWPWVSTIARRLCIDQARRRQRAQLRGVPRPDEVVAAEPDESVLADDEYRWARAAMAELRPHQQRVLHLREVDGWSYDAIATHEGVTVESVRGSLQRSRRALRAAYTRLSAWNPAAVLVVGLRDTFRRMVTHTHRTHMEAAVSGLLNDRSANAVVVALAVGLGMVGSGAGVGDVPRPAAPAQTAAAAPQRRGDVALAAPGTQATSASQNADGTGRNPRITNAPAARATTPTEPPPLLPGQGGPTPEGSEMVAFTPSPDYGHDHGVYASGTATSGCLVSCSTLFRSSDGGRTWARLWSLTFGGGTVMLAPAYPKDDRIFEIDANALRVSADGGHLFRPITPLGGHAAMSPGFSSTDRRILVGAMPGWIWQDGTVVPTPFNLAPEPLSVALSFAHSPSYTSDHRLLVGGTSLPVAGQSLVSLCTATTCSPARPLVGSTGTPSLMTSRSYPTTGVAYAWQLSRLYRSLNGGVSFAPLALPAPGEVKSLSEDGSGGLYLALSNGASAGGLFVSHDHGTTWTRLGTGTALERGATAVMPLPDGHVLAGPAGGGLLCSGDAGASWTPRCS